MMNYNPIWNFNSTTDVGISDVPVNAKILILDSDGNGTPKEITKIAMGSLDSNSTIADFLEDSTLFIEISSGEPAVINGGTY